MDKDLRHMQVYGEAVVSYQHQLYLQTNRSTPTDLGATSNNKNTPGLHTTSLGGTTKAGLTAGTALSSSSLGPSSSSGPGGPTSASASTTGAAAALSLPVRIDPEEEKRLWNLRHKIAAAEVLREQAEQEWVAHQAHYVHMAAVVKHSQHERRAVVQLLQRAVQQRAAVVAQARIRLQMTRDVLQALHYRLHHGQEQQTSAEATPKESGLVVPENKEPNQVEEPEATTRDGTSGMRPSTEGPSGPTATTKPESSEPVGTTPVAMQVDPAAVPPKSTVSGGTSSSNNNTTALDGDALTQVWMQAEEDYKRACTVAAAGTGSPATNTTTTGHEKRGSKKRSNNNNNSSGQPPVAWRGTKLPATPTDVPLLLSVLSTAPDKTVAYGNHATSMIWLPHQLRHVFRNHHHQHTGGMDDDKDAAVMVEESDQGEDEDDVPQDQDRLDDLMAMNDEEAEYEEDLSPPPPPSNARRGAAALLVGRNSRRKIWNRDDTEEAKSEALHSRIRELEQELVRERELNVEWSAKLAASRKFNDEWVAMMSLVRQETEALLHRHNILLESDLALAASEKLHAQDLKERAEAAAAKAAAQGEEEEEEEEEEDEEEEGEEEEGEVVDHPEDTVPKQEHETSDSLHSSKNSDPPPFLSSGSSALDAMIAAAQQSADLPTASTPQEPTAPDATETGAGTEPTAKSSLNVVLSNESTSTATAATTTTTESPSKRSSLGSSENTTENPVVDEAANDGDDEGSGGNNEEEEEWAATNTAAAAGGAVAALTTSTSVATESAKDPAEAHVTETNPKKRSNPSEGEEPPITSAPTGAGTFSNTTKEGTASIPVDQQDDAEDTMAGPSKRRKV